MARNTTMQPRTIIAATALLFASAFSTAVNADMTGFCYQDKYTLFAEDGFGAPDFNGTVVDLWLEVDEEADTLLNIYNFNDVNLGTAYYQSITGWGWPPNNQGGPFVTEALLYADSFVSIGGMNEKRGPQPTSNFSQTGLDGNFGGNDAPGPGENGGWFTYNPSNNSGQAVPTDCTSTGLGIFIGRFSINGGDLSMIGSTGYATYNQGSGTDGQQRGFEVIPAPGALAVLGIAGLAGNRRRRA